MKYFYLHFPFCLNLCGYCDFHRRPLKDSKQIEQFHKYLLDSFKVYKKFNAEKIGPLKTVYIGGGTPSLWGESGAKFFSEFLVRGEIGLTPDIEFTMEVNPGGWEESTFNAWEKVGVNRYSVGVQSFNDKMLKSLGRIHSKKEVDLILSYLRKRGSNFSFDLMLGLPKSLEIKRDIIGELEELMEYRPHHISSYIFTPQDNLELINDEYIRDEYLQVAAYLKGQGYLHYEVSNFALPGRESQHNLSYWRSESVFALGPSATGLRRESSELAYRYKWEVGQAAMEIEELEADKLNLERLYMRLRTNLGINLPDFFGTDKREAIGLLINRWEKREYLDDWGPNLRLTSRGYLMIDSLMDELFMV